MIGATILGFIETRSILDLVLLLAVYAGGWLVYILAGMKLWGYSLPFKRSVISGAFLGTFSLLIKPFLPFIAYNLAMLFLLILILFQVVNMRWYHAFSGSVIINLLAGSGDQFILLPLLRAPGFTRFIISSSLGIAAGSLAEYFLPGLLILIYEVIRCRRTKKRC